MILRRKQSKKGKKGHKNYDFEAKKTQLKKKATNNNNNDIINLFKKNQCRIS